MLVYRGARLGRFQCNNIIHTFEFILREWKMFSTLLILVIYQTNLNMYRVMGSHITHASTSDNTDAYADTFAHL